MKVRSLEEGTELTYPEEGGEIVSCPVCSEVWWDGDDYPDSDCQHLRFVYCTHDPSFVMFSGEWGHDKYEEEINRLANDEEIETWYDVFTSVDHPEIEEIVFLEDEGCPPVSGWVTYFGYANR